MNDCGESASFSRREAGGEGGLVALTGTEVPDPPTLSANEKVKADCLSWKKGGERKRKGRLTAESSASGVRNESEKETHEDVLLLEPR